MTYAICFDNLRVEIDEEIDRPSWAPIDRPDELLEWRAVGAHLEERREVFLQPRLVGERELLRGRLEEEVERIEDRHLRDEIDFHEQLTRLLREHDTPEVIAVRILLPVDEVRFGREVERVAEDRRAAMRRRSQTNDVGPERDAAIVAIVRLVMECDVNSHELCLSIVDPDSTSGLGTDLSEVQ